MSRLITFLFLFLIISEVESQNNLEKAFKYNSRATLNSFFENWQQDIPTITDIELSELSEPVREAYKVFTVFYNPLELSRIGHSEWGDSIYNNQRFFIVQNSLRIIVKEKVYLSDADLQELLKFEIEKSGEGKYKDYLLNLNNEVRGYFQEGWGKNNAPTFENISEYTISDFRPQIKSLSQKFVYLAPQYQLVFNNFLGNGSVEIKEKVYKAPDRQSREVDRRIKFLAKNGIKIWKGHWGNYSQLLSYPEVRTIAFDKNMEYAKVYFKIVYQGGEAYLKKEKDNWILISSKLTWIE